MATAISRRRSLSLPENQNQEGNAPGKETVLNQLEHLRFRLVQFENHLERQYKDDYHMAVEKRKEQQVSL